MLDVTASDAALFRTEGDFILPDLKHTAGRLDSVAGTPAGDERARQRGISEVNRDGVVEDPA